MSIRVALNHKTCYRYTKPVWLSPQVVRLRPAPHCRTPIASYSLKITPADRRRDGFDSLLSGIQDQTGLLSEAIAQLYFSHAVVSREISGIREEHGT